MAVDYAARYQELGLDFVTTTGDNWTARCPFHDDQTASFSVEVQKGIYKCFVPTCEAFKGGNFRQFYKVKTGREFEEQFVVPPAEIDEAHRRLLEDQVLLRWMREFRGWNLDTAKRFRLGYDGERITIPIFADDGTCVNLRRYSPRKGVANKMLSYQPGYGSLRLFPREHLAAEVVVLCEGEPDAILLSQMGYAALSVTGGAGSWKKDWGPLFKGKTVHVLYDIDQAGRQGAQLVCRYLAPHAAVVKDVLLPINSPANGDVTDYVVIYGHGRAELDQLLADAPEWREVKAERPVPGAAADIELGEAAQSRWVGRQVRIKATVAGKDLAPFACPAKVKFTCQMGLKVCRFCSIGQAGGATSYEIAEGSQDLLRLIDCTEEQQKAFLRKAAGVYPGCPRFEMTAEGYHTVEDVRLIPEISFNSLATAEYVVRQGYHVGHGLVPNNVYEMEGTVVPHPQNQYVTLVLPKSKPVKDSVTGFEVTPELVERLKVFQGTDVQERFDAIARDLTANVTRIYRREALVQLLDLVYHSVLQFEFQGRLVKKGWTEALILGDTRCGKTETVSRLIEHYQAGEISTGENASFAGLIGGMQQVGSRWSIIWGKFPLNDRRLLVIDEVSGMPVEDIGKMSGVRSSGIAEIIKVQQEKTFARTRLVWLGNPRSSRSLGTYDCGVHAIKELIGRPEDVARFDAAMTVASGEVPIEVINRPQQAPVPHVYTSDLCHALVMWAWSRKPGDVRFTEAAVKTCLQLSSDLSARYSASIPLVEPAEQRIKLARLSVACAARLFSTETGQEVVVLPAHVEFVADFLRKIFDAPSMNYGAYSRAQQADQKLKDEETVRALLQPYGTDLVEALLDRSYLRLSDLEDVLNLTKAEVKPIVAKLVQNRALKHYHTSYVKSPAFIVFLRKMLLNGLGEPVAVQEEF